jgi:cytochrome c oxidase cbb3-type subunit 2
MRTGPDLSNIGSRQPSRDWQLLHLYDPRMLVSWSIMPRFPFLFDVVDSEKSPSDKAVSLPGQANKWLVPHQDAEALVAYLLCLKRDREPFKATPEKTQEKK